MDTMDSAVSMIKAFGRMLEYTLRTGDDVSDISYGVERILDQQCEDLGFLRDAISGQYERLKESKLEIRDIALTAKWAAVSPEIARRVISIATGIGLEERDGNNPSETVEIGYRSSILNAMQNVANVKAIATETGVGEDKVEAILNKALVLRPGEERFLSEPEPPIAETREHSFNEAFGHQVAMANMGA
ncbi:hypothetical protein GCM10011491_07300 [Brucella endophytica]|uniref:Uncharacterized protein n=1 Tax=Brucella endophytica TaxID=1963359 RepID=A0A916S5H2_9HYPH|nr:hypothetical protein [Brucella endophytica]GGA82427.1 hypothetical protein GCM10011491_07300 [Brucella endophytica]